METNDVNQPNNTGHCMSELAVSGKFLMMAQNGTLKEVSALIQERAVILTKLDHVEQQLRSCNHWYAVSELVEWYDERKEDFASEFIERVEELQRRKTDLTAVKQRIDEQLALQNLGVEWTIKPEFVSLIPESRFNPAVALRFLIIRQNRRKSHQDVCTILDSQFRPGECPEGYFPEHWKDKYGVTTFLQAFRHKHCRNLVDRMISSRENVGP